MNRFDSRYYLLVFKGLLLYFGFWWFFKLDALPGLHGDEAWAGLKANEYTRSNISRFTGMNSYTGILQPLISSSVFKILEPGVSQLRLPGVVANLIALIVLGITFLANGMGKSLIIFLLIIAQSTLFLVSPRIAWEVNSFTLFFLSVVIMAITKILNSSNRYQSFWAFIFLAINLAGTYNHIIFSSVGLSGFLGITLWTVYNRNFLFHYITALIAVNLLNLGLLYFIMQYLSLNYLSTSIVSIIAILFLGLICFEVVFIKKTSLIRFPTNLIGGPLSHAIVYIILAILFLCFCRYHGLALFDVLANQKILTHVYSMRFGVIGTLTFQFTGCLLLFLVLYQLWQDVRQECKSPFAFVLITYLGVLSFYTTNNSLRYYLIAYVLLALYLALRHNRSFIRTAALLLCLAVSLISVNISLIKAMNHDSRPMRPVTFTVGNNQLETSSHFLPSKPLIEFLKSNNAGNIYYLDDRYFLEQPILFHYMIAPWKQDSSRTAIVGYDETGGMGGYLLYLKD